MSTQAQGVVQMAEATEIVQFGSFRSPETSIREAEIVAKTFQRKAMQMELYQQIGPSKHLKIEGWQMLGAMYRVTTGLVEDHYIEIGDAHGYEATAEAIWVPTSQRVSRATAMCLSDEDNWGVRPKYEWVDGKKTMTGHVRVPLQQLRSMAQTRASSKAYANLLKWVARMAGFAPTPAEEVGPGDGGGEPTRGARTPYREPQPRNDETHGAGVISEKQATRLWAIARTANRSAADVGAILARYGFQTAQEVTRALYEQICSEIGGQS